MTLEDLRRRLGQRREELHALDLVVLSGGGSQEREVSLRSGNAVARALQILDYRTEMLAIGRDNISFEPAPTLPSVGREASATLLAETAAMSQLVPTPSQNSIARLRRAGMVLTTMHGAYGENGAWQGLLELLGVPYVSAGVKGSALAMDKLSSKRIAASLGICTPRWWVQRQSAPARPGVPDEVTDLVAKPIDEGSSVGIVMCRNDEAGWEAIAQLNQQFDPLLIEARIFGTELTAGVIGHSSEPICLPLVRIKPREGFYDYRAKYTAGATEYECPAAVAEAISGLVQSRAARLYTELDLEPYARIDFIADSLGEAWFLEANTLPGFTDLSLLPMAGRAAGVDMPELLEMLMLLALERSERKAAHSPAADDLEGK